MTQPTASELADELEALSESATAGPWEEENNGGRGSWIGSSGAAKDWAAMSCGNTDEEAEFNAHLIVALRNNLPAILSALRQVEVMRGAVDEALHQLEHVMGLVRPGAIAYQHNIALAIGSLKTARSALTGEAR